MAKTFYCCDPTCRGWHGVEVKYYPATFTEPGEWERDTCPYCGRGLPNTTARIDTSAVLDAFLDALEEEWDRVQADNAPAYPRGYECDADRVYEVLHRELLRQKAGDK